jgi:hypothetical protein
MDNVVIFYDHFEHFMAIWHNTYMAAWYSFVVIWYIFHILVCLNQEKSGNHDGADKKRVL